MTKKVWETLIQTIRVGHQVMLARLPERERDFSHKTSGISPDVWVSGSVSRGLSAWFVNLPAFLRPSSVEVRNVWTHSGAF